VAPPVKPGVASELAAALCHVNRATRRGIRGVLSRAGDVALLDELIKIYLDEA
jgi:hypothetical protein